MLMFWCVPNINYYQKKAESFNQYFMFQQSEKCNFILKDRWISVVESWQYRHAC